MNALKHFLLLLGLFSSPCSLLSLTVGKPAPTFSLPDENGTLHTLEQYKGSVVIIYFYPSDDTPGCTKQACSLRDSFGEFTKRGIVVLGISYNSPASHKEFKQKYNLPFTLLSDTSKTAAQAYGAKRWWFLPWPKRKTFIIDKHGIVQKVMNNVTVASHGDEVLRAVDKLSK